jgi:hypothetical protein
VPLITNISILIIHRYLLRLLLTASTYYVLLCIRTTNHVARPGVWLVHTTHSNHLRSSSHARHVARKHITLCCLRQKIRIHQKRIHLLHHQFTTHSAYLLLQTQLNHSELCPPSQLFATSVHRFLTFTHQSSADAKHQRFQSYCTRFNLEY